MLLPIVLAAELCSNHIEGAGCVCGASSGPPPLAPAALLALLWLRRPRRRRAG